MAYLLKDLGVTRIITGALAPWLANRSITWPLEQQEKGISMPSAFLQN